MEKKIEEKQSVDIMKQPIVKLGRQVFVVLSMFVLLYFGLFCFHLFLKSIVKTNKGRIWFLCCPTKCYNYAISLF